MEIVATEKFSQFVGLIAGSNNRSSSSLLASFAFSSELPGIESKLRRYANKIEKSFYWEIPDQEIKYLGIGELISITESGKGRFAQSEKRAKTYKDNYISNFSELGLNNVPLFVGGMKFAPENQSEMWENYSDSNWTIPKVILYSVAGEQYIIYNFFIQQDCKQEKLLEEFRLRLNSFLSEFSEKQNTTDIHNNCNIAVVDIKGNSPKDKKKWIENTRKGIEKIDTGELDKIVLSRYIEMDLNAEPDVFCLLDSLKQKYSNCYLFAFHSGKSTFFGASPEKLARFDNHTIETGALAGSIARGTTTEEDKINEEYLLKDSKNLHEHRMVVKFIETVLNEMNCKPQIQDTPAIKKLNNIQHLWTPIKAENTCGRGILSILENLHPTPAVCGFPQSNAYHAIKKIELYPRGLYSGIVGWFNFNGEGEFAVALRSALLKGKRLYAFAGCGIVEGSEAAAEYKETELKLKPITSLFTLNNKHEN